MESLNHKYEVSETRIRCNSWGEEIFRVCETHETWAKSEAKAISNIKYRLYGKAMNSVFPDEIVFYKAVQVI